MNNIKRSIIIFYAIIIYALAQLTWWGYLLVKVLFGFKSSTNIGGALYRVKSVV